MPFNRIHYLVPLIAATAGLIFQYSGMDVWFESTFYDSRHHMWTYRHAWLTETVLHDGGRNFVVLIALGLLLFFVLTLVSRKLSVYRRSAAFLLVSSLSGTGIVSWLKSVTHIYSPWDLMIFGGKYPHIMLFDSVASSAPVGHAFPAGHASGGFALLCFYFLFRNDNHPYRFYFLSAALLTGFVFGLDQEVRGAHMLSHDWFSLAICWSTCMACSRLFFARKNQALALSPEVVVR